MQQGIEKIGKRACVRSTESVGIRERRSLADSDNNSTDVAEERWDETTA